MGKGLKIFVGIIICLGILSLIFLATSKKKPMQPAKVRIQNQVAPGTQIRK